MNMRKSIIIGLAASCAAVSIAAPAIAGLKFDFPVFVDTANRTFGGALGSARNSGDATQTIGCDVVAYANSTFAYMACTATDASGRSAFCASQSANLMAQVRALGSEDRIEVTYDTAGNCTYMRVMKHSLTTPKAH